VGVNIIPNKNNLNKENQRFMVVATTAKLDRSTDSYLPSHHGHSNTSLNIRVALFGNLKVHILVYCVKSYFTLTVIPGLSFLPRT